jgi:hypothetical protein
MKKNFDVRLSTKLGAPAKWALIICTLIFVSAANARQPSDGSAAGLSVSGITTANRHGFSSRLTDEA